MIKTTTTVNGQTIFDLCLQVGYPLEYAFKLAIDSGLSNINDPILGGKIITFDTDYVQDFGTIGTIATANLVDYTNISVGNYILRQDGTPLVRQDGNNLTRQ